MKAWSKVAKLAAILLLFFLVGFYLGVGVTADSSDKTPQASQKTATAPTRAKLLKLVNTERKKAGVKPLELDSRLNVSAQMKADDMLQDGYYGHVDPETGMHGYEYIGKTSTSCTLSGENINHAVNVPFTAKGAVDSWMDSKPHRQAILDPRYELTGFGIAGNKVVQHFCDTK